MSFVPMLRLLMRRLSTSRRPMPSRVGMTSQGGMTSQIDTSGLRHD